MATPPTDAELIDLIGADRVREHFQLSPQSLYNWRTRGIPLFKRTAFAKFAAEHGVEPPEGFLRKFLDRLAA